MADEDDIEIKIGSATDAETQGDPTQENTSSHNNGNERERAPTDSLVQDTSDDASIDKPNDNNEEAGTGSFLSLFRFASTGEKIATVIAVLSSSAFGTVLPLFSLVFGELLDGFQDEDDLVDEVSRIAVYFVYIAIGAFITAYLANMLLQVVAQRQAFKIRAAYFNRVLNQDIPWFDTNEPNQITSSLAEDVSAIQRAIGSNLGNGVQHCSSFLAGLILGLVKGWELTLVILAFLPFLVLSTSSLRYTLLKVSKILQDAYARAGAYLTEAVTGIRTVVAFGGEMTEVESYRKELVEAEDKCTYAVAAKGANRGFMFLVLYSAYGVGLWYGARLIARDREDDPECVDNIDGCFSGGDVMQIFFSVVIGSVGIGQASPDFNAITAAQATAMKIFSRIDAEPSIRLDEGGSKKGTKGKIEFRNVTFEYPSRPEKPVLKNASFAIESGETVALVGASGCGKSTCIQLLQRFYNVNSGIIKLDGTDIRELNPFDIRELFGVVSQEPQLFAASIKENIALGGMSTNQDDSELLSRVVSAAKMASAHDFIEDLPEGYETDVGEKGGQLSGGQKQRIAIARAIFRNPQIVLLDEATSALDASSEKKVQAAIDQMLSQRSEKQTTIIIAHRLSTIRNCDKIIVFANGQVQEVGTHEELLSQPDGVYRNLYELHSSEATDDSIVTDSVEESALPDVPENPDVQGSSKGDEEQEQEQEKIASKKDYDVSWKRVWEYQRPEKWHVVLAVFCSMISGAIMPSFAILFSEMLGIFFDPDTDRMKSDSLKLMGAFIGLGALALITNTLQTYLFEYAGQKLTTRLRVATYKAILRQDMEFFDSPENSPGRLADRLATDAYLVKATVGERIGVVVGTQTSLVTGIIIAFVSSWHLAFVAVAVAPLFLLSGIIEAKAFARLAKEGDQTRSEAGQISQESLGAIRTVHSLNLQEYFSEKYQKALQEPYRLGKKGAHISGATRGGGHFVIFCAYALVFYIGALLIREGHLNFKEMVRVFFALAMGAMGAGHASAFATDASRATSARRSIFQLIDREPTVDAVAHEERLNGEDKPTKIDGKIEFEGVQFSYPLRPGVNVLKGVNLTISPGQTVGFCGESGSGKSTIVQLLQRFYDPQQGEVKVDGVALREHNIANVRRQMGLVSQEPQLFSGNLAYNIAYGRVEGKLPASRRELSGKNSLHSITIDDDIIKAAQDANAKEFIDSFEDGYLTHAGDGGNQLSGGQKQRIAIARALIRSPKILLLDEATSALDSESESVVQATLERLLQENKQQRTTIIVAHRLTTIRNCDLICVFDKGDIVEVGTHAGLISKPEGIYRRLAEAQGLSN